VVDRRRSVQADELHDQRPGDVRPQPEVLGSPKPSISKFVELPFTSEDAIYNEIKSQGPSAITIGKHPGAVRGATTSLAAEGYTTTGCELLVQLLPLNLNTSGTTSPVASLSGTSSARRTSPGLPAPGRPAGWIAAYLQQHREPDVWSDPAVAAEPARQLRWGSFTPCTFSVSDASKLLTSHGWKVAPGGTPAARTRASAGTGSRRARGSPSAWTTSPASVAIQDEMDDLAADAAKVGIHISLTSHPFQTVVTAAVPCPPSSATCKWEAENWGAG